MDGYLQQLAGEQSANVNLPQLRTLLEFERDYIEFVISHTQGNIPRAARILDISPSTLYRKCAQWAN